MNVSPHTYGVLRVPPIVHFGAGSVASVPSVVARHGSEVVVCTDATLAATDGFITLHAALLRSGCRVTVYSDGRPELPLTTIDAAVAAARAADPDVVIGYGGGSSMDLAKLVALLLRHDGPVNRFYGENNVPGPVLPVIAVPTTAGTGSEVTPVAVVADPERDFKVGISSPWLVPAAAVVDPVLTEGCPATVRSHSGADALAHALEALTAGRRQPEWGAELPVFVGAQSIGDILALQAASSIGASLPTAVADLQDEHAMSAMAHGSLCAGMAFGTSGTHLGHALQYSIGAATNTTHGLGVGLLLPYVLEASAPACADRLGLLAGSWALRSDDAPEVAVIDRVEQITASIGLPRTLADIGLQRSELPRLAEQSLGFARLVQNAPVEAGADLLLAILEAAWAGDRDRVRAAVR